MASSHQESGTDQGSDFDLFAEFPTEPQAVEPQTVESIVAPVELVVGDDKLLGAITRLVNAVNTNTKDIEVLKEENKSLRNDNVRLKRTIHGLKQVILRDSHVLVGEEPREPLLEEYTGKCEKCSGMGKVWVAVDVMGSGKTTDKLEHCECYTKWFADHAAWKENHRHWKDQLGRAVRRDQRNERDIKKHEEKDKQGEQ